MLIGGLAVVQVTTPTTEKRRRFGWVKDVNGNPVSRRVLLIDHRTATYIASTVSRASDGYWEIRGLPITIPDYSILEVAIDDTRAYDSPSRCHKSLVV